MKRNLISILICLVFLALVTPLASHAVITDELQQKIEETRQQRDALLEEQRKLQAQLEVLNKENKTLTGTVQGLDATRRKLLNDIKLTQTKISSANLNIRALEGEMTEKEKQIATQQRAIKESIQKLAGYDSSTMVLDLLSFQKISDVWRDKDTLNSIQNDLLDQIDSLRDAKAQLQRQKELKEKNKSDLVNFQGELGGQKQTVEQTQAAKQKLLNETKNQEAAYQKLLADNIAREKKFEADLFAYESLLKIELDKSLIPVAAPSILSWPLDRVNITQRFGVTTDSGRLYASGSHNGVDFGTPTGSAVKAVRQGVVWGMGNTDSQAGCYSYGRWIMIKHDNGLSTLYAHLSSSIVSVGQTVTRGQIIGYSGGIPGAYGSGYSTGAHLHLGLYATQGTRIQLYTSSINCKQVSIPIADPKAYLDPLSYMPVL
jgi:murein DD-endopeptidase MepM/ murein hydrolase activator NlpD